MTIKIRTIFFIILGVLAIWLVSAIHTILSPFLWAAILAYICNPLVNILSKKAHIPRWLSVIFVFFLLSSTLVVLGTLLTRRLIEESSEIRDALSSILISAKSQVHTLPEWFRPSVVDFLTSLEKSRFTNSISLLPFFPKAISRIISFFVFLVSAFYFLKDGNNIFEKILTFVPNKYKVDVEILLRKINSVLGGYLRGQIFLVVLMSLFTFISLSILGVKFAVFLGVFSGFAEIVPIVGPIVAAAVSILVVLLTGQVNFGLTPIYGAVVVAILYFVLRHAEDYFIIPHVMGRITKLPAFVIFFAVVAGGHIGGILGLILAVPIAAIIRILLEFSLDQINEKHK